MIYAVLQEIPQVLNMHYLSQITVIIYLGKFHKSTVKLSWCQKGKLFWTLTQQEMRRSHATH